MSNSEKLISWLKYLDVEYLDDAACEALAKLNINNPNDVAEIISTVGRNNRRALRRMATVLFRLFETAIRSVLFL